eukprot:TRINITY_DN8982_c3_g1_i1.p1 TRINITY_DN8982_c3_g1~~TRINITY_DN8982_c3_g1_i1.p1  ORF type:complete len:533 (-),score=165.10 TRINITY_DN8982_c3_g1_i1:36-1634(-)
MADHLIKSSYADIPLPEISLRDYMLGELRSHPPDNVALVDANTGESLTYGQTIQAIERLGLHFAHAGVTKGSVVAIFVPNHIYFAIVFHAISNIGATSTTCNPLYTPGEVANQLRDSGASFIVTTQDGFEKSQQAAHEVDQKHGKKINHIWTLEPHSGAVSVRELLEQIPKMKELPNIKIDPKNDIVTIPYSSGTTGLPKGVVLTHFNIVSNILQMKRVDPHGASDCTIAVLPLFHVYGLTVIMNALLAAGSKIVVMSKFDLVQFLELIVKYKPTVAHLVPPIILGLAKHPIVAKYDVSSLKVITSAAAPLGIELQKEAADRLKVVLKQGYGMSELSPASHVTPNNFVKLGSCGVLLPNEVAKIVEDGKVVARGKTGEIWIKGPNVMKGYLNNPKATADTITPDGFLRTGDIGYADEDGHFYIVDRLKELIKYKGFQVPPAELEAKLLSHPGVADAAVIAVPDEEAGEIPRAFVVLKPNVKITDKELASWIEERVAPHKKLRGGVVFTDAIPKTAAGKILRRILSASVRSKL